MNLSKKRGSGDAKMELQIAPLIDVVFLLLIYFMVTASLIKKEGDINFVLPVSVSTPVSMPVEAPIFIMGDGAVEIEGLLFPATDLALKELTTQVIGLREMAESQGTILAVTLTPHPEAFQGRVVDVMDACVAGGGTNLTFGESSTL